MQSSLGGELLSHRCRIVVAIGATLSGVALVVLGQFLVMHRK